MANYLYRISSVKFGTPTGSNTMPASGDLTALPNTTKGTFNISQSDSTVQEFYVDQLPDPIMVLEDQKGKLEVTMKFYDVDYEKLATLTGGTGNASGYAPASGSVNVVKAFQIDLVTDHRYDLYNAKVEAKIGGSGGNDSMFTMDVKLTALATTDTAGSWHVGPKS